MTSNVDSVPGNKRNLMYLIGQDKVGKHAHITLDPVVIIPLLSVSQFTRFHTQGGWDVSEPYNCQIEVVVGSIRSRADMEDITSTAFT